MSAALLSPVETRDGANVRRVTVRPAPRREPPYDDELPWPVPHFVGPHDRRLPFEQRRRGTTSGLPRVLRRGDLPDPAGWGRRLLVGIGETAAGRRPLHQLAALLSPSVLRGLSTDFERTAVAGSRHWLHNGVVRTVRASEPCEGVAELCATVHTGPRVHAVAIRLEARHGRWRCTRLQLG